MALSLCAVGSGGGGTDDDTKLLTPSTVPKSGSQFRWNY